MSCLPRALIIAHYDRDGLIDPHLLYALASYRRVFAQIIFVSVSTDCLPKGQEHLADLFIARENIGYDFFSWKIGFNALKNKHRFFEVVFVNDSIYGPLFDVEHMLMAPAVKEADFWGATSSFEHSWHIQSYFFAMRHPLVTSNDAQAYWDAVDPLRDKDQVIMRYEIPMAGFFRNRGWSTAAVYNAPTNPLKKNNNPMHFRWLSAIYAGVPFVKVELLRTNPYGLSLQRIHGFIGQSTRYPLSLIEAHVQRTN